MNFLGSRQERWEIVVVDDGSADRTSACIHERFGDQSAVRVLRNEWNHGKGFAVRAGVLASRGSRALLSDADLATPIAELAKLERHAEAGFGFPTRGVLITVSALQRAAERSGPRETPDEDVRTLRPAPGRTPASAFPGPSPVKATRARDTNR